MRLIGWRCLTTTKYYILRTLLVRSKYGEICSMAQGFSCKPPFSKTTTEMWRNAGEHPTLPKIKQTSRVHWPTSGGSHEETYMQHQSQHISKKWPNLPQTTIASYKSCSVLPSITPTLVLMLMN